MDINYRASLWSLDGAFAWLESVIDRVDVLAASRGDLLRLDVTGEDDEVYRRAVDAEVAALDRLRGKGKGVMAAEQTH